MSAGARRAHESSERIKLIAGGERGGKSRFSAEEAITWLMWAPGGIFWIVGPSYELARPEFEYMLTGLLICGMVAQDSVSMPLQGSCRFQTITGAIVETKTSTDVEKLAGIAPSGILMVEAAQHPYESFLRLRGRVAERRGPLVLSGTFEGALGWYQEVYTRWQAENEDGARSFSLPSWENRVVYPGGREDPEILALERTFPPDVFMERFGAVPCPPPTLVFKEFRHETHVGRYPYKEGQPVQLWVDPGYAHAYAVVVVQIDQGKVYQIDEVYHRGWVADDIIAACKRSVWWKDVSRIVMDRAGLQHHGMESQEELWRKKTGKAVTTNKVPIPAGILRHRTFLMDPATREPRLFHDRCCSGTIAEYGKYRFASAAEYRPVSEAPIDRENDAMKAIAYGLIANFGYVDMGYKHRPVRVSIRSGSGSS